MKRILPLLILITIALPFGAQAALCDGKDNGLNLCYPNFGGRLTLNTPLDGLIKWFYTTIVTISGLAAFVMLVWGGITWMSSAGSPTAISDARGRIQSALLGLLLVLASFLILQVVNPELTVLNIPTP